MGYTEQSHTCIYMHAESIGYAHKANRTYTRSSAAISNAPRLIEVTKEKDIKMNIK